MASWPGVETTRTRSPATRTAPGIIAGVAATPTSENPAPGTFSVVTDAGVSSDPAATSSAARCPTSDSSCEAGTTLSPEPAPTSTVDSSERSITLPRSIVTRATTTDRASVVAACSHTFPTAPTATRASIAANTPHRRRGRGGAGTRPAGRA